VFGPPDGCAAGGVFGEVCKDGEGEGVGGCEGEFGGGGGCV
jgi:hypothetical protein